MKRLTTILFLVGLACACTAPKTDVEETARLVAGQISQDCWSRGNGWGAMALGALMRDLPKDNQHYPEVCELAQDFFQAVRLPR